VLRLRDCRSSHCTHDMSLHAPGFPSLKLSTSTDAWTPTNAHSSCCCPSHQSQCQGGLGHLALHASPCCCQIQRRQKRQLSAGRR